MTSWNASVISSGPISTTWCWVPSSSRDLPLERRLVEERIAERERERAQLMVGLLDGERGRQARVEAAGEVAADGHVGAQAQPHGVAQQLAELLGRGRGRVDRVARLPPGALLDDLAVAPDEQAAGRQLADALERAARGAGGPEREDLVDALEVGHGLDHARGEHALDLAREDDAAVGQQRVVQRAHAEAVAHQRERARVAVEVGDAPLAVAAVQGLRAVAVEQAQQDLGVAGRAEALALGLELAAQLVVVEDLAVVDHHGVAVRRPAWAASRTGCRRSRAGSRRARRRRRMRCRSRRARGGGSRPPCGGASARRRRAPSRRAGCPRCRTRQRPAGWFEPSTSMMRAPNAGTPWPCARARPRRRRSRRPRRPCPRAARDRPARCPPRRRARAGPSGRRGGRSRTPPASAAG